MSRLIFALLMTSLATAAQAQTLNHTCSWGVLSNFTKTTAATEQCTRYAGANGIRPDNPKRSAWIADCSGMVNAAVASCSDTDLACMKSRIQPLQGQVCALNEKYGK